MTSPADQNDIFLTEIKKAALALEVPFAALAAVVWVESAGRWRATIEGKDEPLIRFEGHYFDRLISPDMRDHAREMGLSHPKAGRVKNPKTQKGRWDLLRKAQAIDRNAALESTSWGVGQVMGANWKMLSYPSVEAMVLDTRSGLSGQLRVMCRFIKKRNLLKYLRNQDFAAFARVYNGPAFKRYGYDRRMAKAFQKFSDQYSDIPTRNHLALGDSGDDVKSIQQHLNGLGFSLVLDGDFGPSTKRAIERFQTKMNLEVDGLAGPETFRVLQFWSNKIAKQIEEPRDKTFVLNRSLRYAFAPWNKISKR